MAKLFTPKSLTKSPAESLGSDYMHYSRRDSISFVFLRGLLVPRLKEPAGDFFCSLLVHGLRIPSVDDVAIRFSASPGAGTTSTTGTK